MVEAMVPVEELATVPLFASMSSDDLARLAPLFELRSVSERTQLAGEGASGYSFYVLAEGSAAVTHDETTVAQIGPGDFFGEGAILGDGRRGATVTTTSPSKVLVMFGTSFRRLEMEHPAVASAIEDAMRRRSLPLAD
jgi:CRP-like cAMP-binding protein